MRTATTRKLLGLAIAGLSLLGAAHTAQAQAFPNRTLHWVVPYAAGGGADALARLIQPALSKELGQPVVIENKPGAASSIAASEVARSAPDGYTFISADPGTLLYNPALFKKLSYDPAKDFAPVSLLARLPTILVVGPASNAKDAKDLIAQIKAADGKMSYASAGTGSPHAMAMELLKNKAGLNMIHVPYRGGALSLQDVVAGQVPMTMTDFAGGGGMIKSGKVRALAVANATRLTQLPDVPTFAELGYKDVLAEAYGAIMVPAKTPPDVIAKLHTAFAAVVAMPEIRQKLLDIGYEPVGNSPAQLQAMIAADAPRWQKLIKDLNITLD